MASRDHLHLWRHDDQYLQEIHPISSCPRYPLWNIHGDDYGPCHGCNPSTKSERQPSVSLLPALTGLSTDILCLCWQAIHYNTGIIIFTAIYSFCSGAIVSLMSACMAQVPEDPRNIDTYMDMGMFTVSFAALIGPPINGALLDRYHVYEQSSIFSGIVVLVGACLLGLL